MRRGSGVTQHQLVQSLPSITLAVIAAFCFAGAAVLQHRAVSAEPDPGSSTLSLRGLREQALLRRDSQSDRVSELRECGARERSARAHRHPSHETRGPAFPNRSAPLGRRFERYTRWQHTGWITERVEVLHVQEFLGLILDALVDCVRGAVTLGLVTG